MAKYTIELRKVCDIYGREEVESWFEDYRLEDYLLNSQIETIEKAGLWNKNKLAKKIVDTYYMREIGFETPALFAHYARITMSQIMEKELFYIYTNAIEYDPLINVDFTETFKRNIDNTSKNNQTSNSNSNSQDNSSFENENSSNTNSNTEHTNENLSINNNTPQTNITKQNLDSGVYANNVSQQDTKEIGNDSSNATGNASGTGQTSSSQTMNSTNNLNGESNTVEEYQRHQKGNSGSLTTSQKLIELYRQNIYDVDTRIIKQLNSLFMRSILNKKMKGMILYA